MRRTSVLRARRGSALVVLSTLAIMTTTLLVGVPTSGAAVSPTTPWQTMTTPGLLGPNEGLADVSCPTVTFCMAVGTSNGFAGNTTAIADVWKGSGNWTATSVPKRVNLKTTTQESKFFGVSCSSPTYCMAVGYGTQSGLAELWNGTKWTVTPQPSAGMPLLSTVSCVAKSCVAIWDGGATAIWNGSGWTIESTNLPVGTSDIACFAAEQCLAVGSGNSPSIAEYFNNGTWTDTAPPQRPPGGYNALQAVSCPAATKSATCMAVGFSNGPTLSPPFAEVWDATTGAWTSTSTVTSGGQPVEFDDVSCPTASWCVAISENAAEVWNGSAWTLMNTSNLVSGSKPYSLSGVSCPSTTFCVAAGSKQVTTGARVAAAYWGTLP